MNKQIITVLTTLLVFCSCNNREDRMCNELKQISNSVSKHTREPGMRLQESDIIAPKRYHEMFELYWDFEKKVDLLTNLIDSLIKNDINSFTQEDREIFKDFFIELDKIYIPRLDTVIVTESNGNKYQYTQFTYLKQYIDPIKEKIEFSSTHYDLELIRLYMMLIDREVISFIHEEAQKTTVPINFIKPITIKERNKLNCYFAAVDTCNYPYVLIGRFKHIKVSEDRELYKPIHIHDTIYFNHEKASIDLDMLKGYEAVATFIGPYGESIQYQVY